MRNSFRILVVTAMALGAVAFAAVPGGAGAILKVNKVTVVKVVDGPVTADTTFTVGVDCTQLGLSGTAGPTAAQHTDITFDSTGQPTSNDTVSVGAGVACTATETVNGGATSTTYACEMEHDSSDPGTPFQGNCTADNAARFNDVLGDTATITVTNTFPTPTPKPIEPPVVQAIQATPTFTG
jgi:hypothetical protein